GPAGGRAGGGGPPTARSTSGGAASSWPREAASPSPGAPRRPAGPASPAPSSSSDLHLGLARHQTRLQSQLVGRELQGLLARGEVDALHLVEHAARLDHGDPALRRALALAHAGFRRLLRHRLVPAAP